MTASSARTGSTSVTMTWAPSPRARCAIPRPHQPNPATTTVRPASRMLVARNSPSMTDWPVPCVLSSISRVPVASAATAGKASAPRWPSGAAGSPRPGWTRSRPPPCPAGRAAACAAPPSGRRRRPRPGPGPASRARWMCSPYSARSAPARANTTAAPEVCSAAAMSSWVDSGLEAARNTWAPPARSAPTSTAVSAVTCRQAATAARPAAARRRTARRCRAAPAWTAPPSRSGPARRWPARRPRCRRPASCPAARSPERPAPAPSQYR